MNKLLLVTALAAGLTGCLSTKVSPMLAGKPGVVIGMGPEGYPSIESVEFSRGALRGDVKACLLTSVNAPETDPVLLGPAVMVAGKSSFNQPMGLVGYPVSFRYTLTVSASSYKFTRLQYLRNGDPTTTLMAIQEGGPEHAYAALEDISKRIDTCLVATSD